MYVNAKGVSRFDDATVYTTAKNVVAGAVLLLLALALVGRPRRSAARAAWPRTGRQRLGLIAVACIGGSVPFVLFFEGLARASATQAAFIHKTLVVWVAVLAVVLLRERLGPLHLVAIGLLMAGQVLLVPSVGVVRFGTGEAMILAATLFWAVEVIVVKRLVVGLEPQTLAAGRMALGTVVLARLARRVRAHRRAVGPRRWANGPGRCSPESCSPRTSRRGTRRSRGRRPSTSPQCSSSARWSPPCCRARPTGVPVDALGLVVIIRRRRRRSGRGAPGRSTGLRPDMTAGLAPLRPLRVSAERARATAAPTRPRTLLEYGAAGASDGGLAELARTFEGAWPYLSLIAAANRIDDPLDPRVVEAYWVGNALLDRVRARRSRAARGRPVPRPHRPDVAAGARHGRRRRGAAPLRSTSSPSTPGSACCARESSTSRSTSSTSAGRQPPSSARSTVRRRACSPAARLGRASRWRSGHGPRGTSAGATTASGLVAGPPPGRLGLAALGRRLRPAHAHGGRQARAGDEARARCRRPDARDDRSPGLIAVV